MGIEIESSKDGNKLVIDGEGRALVDSQSRKRSFYVSRDEQRVFNTIFEDANAVAGEFVAYFRNTSQSRFFVVELARLGGANAATWKIHKVTGTPVADGGSPVPVNLNFGSGILAEAETFEENVTGIVSQGETAIAGHGAGQGVLVVLDDAVIMPPDTAIAFQYEVGTTGIANVGMRGYYEDL
jgi:hypothetical protein